MLVRGGCECEQCSCRVKLSSHRFLAARLCKVKDVNFPVIFPACVVIFCSQFCAFTLVFLSFMACVEFLFVSNVEGMCVAACHQSLQERLALGGFLFSLLSCVRVACCSSHASPPASPSSPRCVASDRIASFGLFPRCSERSHSWRVVRVPRHRQPAAAQLHRAARPHCRLVS